MEDAPNRWFRPNEVHAILSNYARFKIQPQPVDKPQSMNLSYHLNIKACRIKYLCLFFWYIHMVRKSLFFLSWSVRFDLYLAFTLVLYQCVKMLKHAGSVQETIAELYLKAS